MLRTTRVNRVLSGVVAWSVGSLGLATVSLSVGAATAEAAVSPVVERSSSAVTANPLPTVQIDGVAWAQSVVGNTVYAGGQFANARPAGAAAGTSQTTRNNLLAYDITTGNLATGFNPNLNAQVKAMTTSPDKKRLYVGGSFTSANGVVRNRIAAYDTATGALISTFAPNFNGTVTALTATDSTVYVAGWFNTVNGQPRTRLAAVTAATGALTTWTATLDADPTSIVLTPDQSKVVVGGKFQNVSGSAQQGITALNPATAAVLDWQVNRVIRNGNDLSGTYSLSVDNDTVYGSSFNYGTGNFEGIFAMNQDGSIRWLADCHGDTYASFSVNNIVYSAGHPHHCSNIGGFYENSPRWEWRATAFTKEVTGEVQPNNQFGSGYGDFRGRPSPSLVHWFPQFAPGKVSGQAQAVWSLSGNSTYVVAGGEFPSVNGKGQQGLVRFASAPTSPSSGATQLGGASNPTVRPLGNAAARISWSANWDRDDRKLTYKLVRSDRASAPLDTRTVESSFWERPVQAFTDTSVVPGQTYRYRIIVADPSGVGTQSDYVSVTIPTTPLGSYAKAVVDDGASNYFRLDDAGSATLADLAGGNDLSGGTGVTKAAAGAIAGDDDGAATLTSPSGIGTKGVVRAPNIFTAETWMRTRSTAGGKILGFGTSATGSSGSYDRHIYMDKEGRLIFGVHPGSVRTVSSATGFNDGQWHHVVAQLSPAGQTLYVDGQQVGTNAATTSGQDYNGYWRIGNDNLNGWPGTRDTSAFSGDIDETAIYPTALTVAQIRDHYTKSSGTPGSVNAAPQAAFTTSVQGMAVAFDSSGSSDADGTIVSRAWDFGDGTTGTGAAPSHTYTQGGTYTVKLTVTDDDGAVDSITQTVSVATANQAPKAAFTTTAAGLAVALDASGSSDADGSIASYAWKFGDGATGTGVTTDHTYTAAGTYTVELTVTDDKGMTASSTKVTTVSATNVAPRAAFTSAVDGSVVTLNASGSSDTDGSIASYAWDFGNGRTGSGETTTQTYAAGTYTVKLTVTDDDGATDTSTDTVTVAAAPSPTLAADEFSRTGTGWGTADTGGAWTLGGGVTNFSTTGTAGAMRMPATSTIPTATLDSVSAADVVVTTDVSVDKVVNGTGLSTMVMARRESSRNYYWVKVRHMADGSVNLAQGRRLDGTEATFREIKVAGLTYAPGTKLRVQLKVSGTSTATLTAKVWTVGGTEPTTAQITSTDTSAGLAAAGSVGLRTYTSGSTTNVPVTLSVDRFTAVRP